MEHRSYFIVKAPIDAVREFHQSARSLNAITPPLIPMTSVEAPDPLVQGSEMAFTLWMGPIPVRWIAHIEEGSPSGFVDRQVKEWWHLYEIDRPAYERRKEKISAKMLEAAELALPGSAGRLRSPFPGHR